MAIPKICTFSKSKAIVLCLDGNYVKFYRSVSDAKKSEEKRNKMAKIYRKAMENYLKRNK